MLALNTPMRYVVKTFIILFAVLGLLSLPSWYINFFHTAHANRSVAENKVSADLSTIGNQFELFRLDHGAYPDKIEALVGGYLKSVPMDPWGNKYQMKIEEGNIILFTFNPSKAQGRYSVRLEYGI